MVALLLVWRTTGKEKGDTPQSQKRLECLVVGRLPGDWSSVDEPQREAPGVCVKLPVGCLRDR